MSDNIESATCTGHQVYYVEVKARRLFNAKGEPHDYYTDQWKPLHTERVIRPTMEPSFPSGGDNFIPKTCAALTYAQAMAAAWSFKAMDEYHDFDVRIIPALLEYSWSVKPDGEPMFQRHYPQQGEDL